MPVDPGTPSADPFAGVTDFAAETVDGTLSVDGGPTFDHVNGIAFGKTGSINYLVVSDASQGIVLIPEDSMGSPMVNDMVTLPTGAASAPTGVVTADLDGDGNDDIIAVDGPDYSLSVMFGKSDGTFTAPVLVPLASKPTQFVLADVDGDGHPDLLVPDAAAGTLDLYTNDGHGGFAVAPMPVAAGSHPFSIAGGDLDGDGHVDLVVGDSDDSLSVLLNDGHGTFVVSNYSTSGVHPDHLYLGMLAGSAIFISATNAADNAGAFFQGNGDGTFQPAVLNSGGDCAMTICATATPVTTTQGSSGSSGRTSKPSKPAAAVPASAGGGDIGLLSLMLLGIAALRRRFAR